MRFVVLINGEVLKPTEFAVEVCWLMNKYIIKASDIYKT